MPANGRRSRRAGGSVYTERRDVYALCYDRPLGTGGLGAARHYIGSARPGGMAGRIQAHRDGTCGARLPMAFHAAGISFLVVLDEPDAPPGRENQLKVQGGFARRCTRCKKEGDQCPMTTARRKA